MTMTCDLRTSAVGLPSVMVGQQLVGESESANKQTSWMSKVTADDMTEEDAEKQRKLEQRKSWIGGLHFECDLLELDGSFNARCKVPAPPAQTSYRAFVHLPHVEEGEQAPQFFVSWSRGDQ